MHRETSVVSAYMVHVRRALLLYCNSLPLALVQDFGW
jgi:ion channel-forming bestrophin family protein